MRLAEAVNALQDALTEYREVVERGDPGMDEVAEQLAQAAQAVIDSWEN